MKKSRIEIHRPFLGSPGPGPMYRLNPLSLGLISAKVKDGGNLSTYYRKFSAKFGFLIEIKWLTTLCPIKSP
jgi:hypothetical protein